MRLKYLALACVAGAFALAAASAQAITFGQPDENRHPNVGALLADWDPDSPGLDEVCSGTLIAPTVFLTASHCTSFLEEEGLQAWVTFAPVWDEESTSLEGLYSGTMYTNPEYGFSGPGGHSDPHDIAVVVLDRPVVGVTPAELPTLGLLDAMKTSGALRDATFTAVGYGTVREDKTGGFHALFYDVSDASRRSSSCRSRTAG